MPSLSKQLENWLKPLRLEEKQDFTNKSVMRGLDKFLMGQCDDLLRQKGFGFPGKNEFLAFLKGTRGAFSQYMTLDTKERRDLVAATQKQIKEWMVLLPKEVIIPAVVTEKRSLSDPVLPFVPKEKQRAFHLTGLKTVDDLLHYSPKWAINKSSFTPIAQCVNREEPYFILGRINGISEMRRGPRVMVKVVLQDASGHLNWVWFNRPYLKKELTNGRWVLLHETPQVSKWGKQVIGRAETFEFLTPEEEQALREGEAIVFYPSTPTLTQSFWREIVGKVLGKYGDSILSDRNDLSVFGKTPLVEAVQKIHHPESMESFEQARKRLAFEELLTL